MHTGGFRTRRGGVVCPVVPPERSWEMTMVAWWGGGRGTGLTVGDEDLGALDEGVELRLGLDIDGRHDGKAGADGICGTNRGRRLPLRSVVGRGLLSVSLDASPCFRELLPTRSCGGKCRQVRGTFRGPGGNTPSATWQEQTQDSICLYSTRAFNVITRLFQHIIR